MLSDFLFQLFHLFDFVEFTAILFAGLINDANGDVAGLARAPDIGELYDGRLRNLARHIVAETFPFGKYFSSISCIESRSERDGRGAKSLLMSSS